MAKTEEELVQENFNLLLTNANLEGRIATLSTIMANPNAMESPLKMTLLLSQLAQTAKIQKTNVETRLGNLKTQGGKDAQRDEQRGLPESSGNGPASGESEKSL